MATTNKTIVKPKYMCTCDKKEYEILDPCEKCGVIFCVICSGTDYSCYCFTCKIALTTFHREKNNNFKIRHSKHKVDSHVSLCVKCVK